MVDSFYEYLQFIDYFLLTAIGFFKLLVVKFSGRTKKLIVYSGLKRFIKNSQFAYYFLLAAIRFFKLLVVKFLRSNGRVNWLFIAEGFYKKFTIYIWILFFSRSDKIVWSRNSRDSGKKNIRSWKCTRTNG